MNEWMNEWMNHTHLYISCPHIYARCFICTCTSVVYTLMYMYLFMPIHFQQQDGVTDIEIVTVVLNA